MKVLTPEEAKALRLANSSKCELFTDGAEWQNLRSFYRTILIPRGYVNEVVHEQHNLVSFVISSLGRDALMCYDFCNLSVSI